MIKVYSTPDCVFCHALMAWLEKQGIEFKERNLANEKTRAKLEAKFDREFKSAPVVVIGDEVIEGFNRPAIKRALKKL